MAQLKELLANAYQNKGKFFLVLFSALFFAVLIFPFNDLRDLISSQISKRSNNSVYLQFENLEMSIIPQPGFKMEKIHLETLQTPAISMTELTVTPAIRGLLTQQPYYGHANAKGLLKGDVDIKVSKGPKTDNGVDRQRIELKASKVSLHDVREFANLPVLLKGQLNLNSTALADLTFQEQPDIDLNLTVQKFELPPASIETMMGPLILPDLKLTSIELKGRLADGRFIIENGVIGKPGDEIYGSIKGNMVLNIVNRGGRFAPQMGAYSFDIDLTAKKSFEDRAGLFLTFIDSYKSPAANGSKYKFKASATNPMMPPNFGAAR